MKRIWVPLCFILGFVMLAHSLYFWGGLAGAEEVGSMAREKASSFSFLVWAYLTAGQGILDLTGLSEAANQFTQAQVGHIFVAMKETPYTAMNTLFMEIPWYTRISYYGGPLMLLIGTFAQLRKPKQFKTYG